MSSRSCAPDAAPRIQPPICARCSRAGDKKKDEFLRDVLVYSFQFYSTTGTGIVTYLLLLLSFHS